MKNILTCLLVLCLTISSLLLFTACNQNKIIEVATQQELANALTSTQKNLTIKLTNNIATTNQLVVSRKIVLDLNGKKITNEQMTTDIWNDNDNVDTWSLISVQGNGDLTIKGNGTLKAKENDCYAIDIRDNAVCKIENGTFIGNIHSVYVYKGKLSISGGTYSIQQVSNNAPYGYVLNCYDANFANQTAKITVTGGTFMGFNPSNCQAEGANTNFVATGYTVTTNSGTTPPTYTVSKTQA